MNVPLIWLLAVAAATVGAAIGSGWWAKRKFAVKEGDPSASPFRYSPPLRWPLGILLFAAGSVAALLAGAGVAALGAAYAGVGVTVVGSGLAACAALAFARRSLCIDDGGIRIQNGVKGRYVRWGNVKEIVWRPSRFQGFAVSLLLLGSGPRGGSAAIVLKDGGEVRIRASGYVRRTNFTTPDLRAVKALEYHATKHGVACQDLQYAALDASGLTLGAGLLRRQRELEAPEWSEPLVMDRDGRIMSEPDDRRAP